MVWSQLAGIRTPPIVTTDFLYIRFIGDRTSIDEKDFGKIQKDRISEMNRWAGRIKKVEKEKKGGREGEREEISLAMIAANNHYAGFVPGTSNMFRSMVGLLEVFGYTNTNNNNNKQLILLYLSRIRTRNDKRDSRIL
jgi:uncharacterized protein YecE (DUF72 family)